MNTTRKALICLGIYLAGFVLTYGYIAARSTDRYPEVDAFMTAIMWPAYWPLHLSRKLQEQSYEPQHS